MGHWPAGAMYSDVQATQELTLRLSGPIVPALPGAILLGSYRHLVEMKTSPTQGMGETGLWGNFSKALK